MKSLPSEDNIVELCHALWRQHLGESDYNRDWHIVGLSHGRQHCLLMWQLDGQVQYTAIESFCVANHISMFIHHLDPHTSAVYIGTEIYVVLIYPLILTFYPDGVCRQIQSVRTRAVVLIS